MKKFILSLFFGLFLVAIQMAQSSFYIFRKIPKRMVIKSLFREKSRAWLLNNRALVKIMAGLKILK